MKRFLLFAIGWFVAYYLTGWLIDAVRAGGASPAPVGVTQAQAAVRLASEPEMVLARVGVPEGLIGVPQGRSGTEGTALMVGEAQMVPPRSGYKLVGFPGGKQWKEYVESCSR